MTNEDAISRLEALKDEYKCSLCDTSESDKDCPLKSNCEAFVKSINIAIEALQKQTAKKPILDFQESGDFYWYCPTCNEVVKSHIAGTPIVNEHNRSNCGGCAQAIDWSDEEED